MRDKDLRLVADLVLYHRTGKRARATRSEKEEWALIRFTDWALPLLNSAGAIGFAEDRPEKPVPGGAALRKRDVA